MKTCPKVDRLKAFLVGQIHDEAEFSGIQDHLATCQECLNTVEGSVNPTHLEIALKSAVQDDFVNEQECIEVVNKIATAKEAQASEGSTDASVPKRIGPYEIMKKLGEGGMGEVYLGRHQHLQKTVAIKLLRTPDSERAKQRFVREMRSVGKIDHPNIVQATDGGEFEGSHFLVMEFLRGNDLAEIAKRKGQLEIADACELVRQAAIGLQYIHENGMVHRDIKTKNIMLALSSSGNKQPVVKILDLGLASISEGHQAFNDELTATGQIMGTLDYMSPEQAFNSSKVDIRTDIYGLGATLFRLLGGRTPSQVTSYESFGEKFNAILNESAPSISTLRSDLPKELIRTIDKMLARDPNDRWSTPAEVANALEPFAVGHDLAQLFVEDRNLKPSTDGANEECDEDYETLFVATETSLEMDHAAKEEPAFVQPKTKGVSEKAAAQPKSVPPNKGTSRRLIVGAGFGAFAFLLGVILFVVTDTGTMKIEILDPEIKVEVDGKQINISGGVDPMTVRAGAHHIEIDRNGSTIEVEAFKVKRGENVGLIVSFQQGELVLKEGDRIIAQNGEVISPAANDSQSNIASTSNDRLQKDIKVAEKVFELGGETSWVGKPGRFSSMPPEPTGLTGVFLDDLTHDYDLAIEIVELLNGSPHLQHVHGLGHMDALRKLTDAPEIRSLHFANRQTIASQRISDDAMKLLHRYPKLNSLRFENCRFTSTGVSELVRHPNSAKFETLGFPACSLDSGSLESLATLSSLSWLELGALESLTPEMLNHLQSSRLEFLSVIHNPLDARHLEAIAKIKTLESLWISQVSLPLEAMESLVELPRLKFIKLDGEGFSDEQIQSLRRTLTNVAIRTDSGDFLPYSSERE